MNTVVLRRKLIYVGAIVLLLVPLYFLGHPSVRDAEGEPTNQGGTLAQIRTRDDLGQSDLGALDPASESARLATLGLRGVAATILWQKAEYYKKEKYFDRMAATVNQLKILQPHFVKVWDYQAHNIAYNTSVEFDNYKHRYDWVKKGIYYLIEGCKFNKSRTELPFQLGDFVGSKLGIADEKVQFRELFRNDVDFHSDVNELSKLDMTVQEARGPDGKPDNWRAGALWYGRSYDMVAQGSRPAKSPLMFYCKDPQWQLKHSEAIQSEGYLGEEARSAWKVASTHLAEFGSRQIRTSFGTVIYLSELEKTAQEYLKKENEFKEFCGDTYKEAYQKLEQNLSDEQRAAMAKDKADLTFEELLAIEQARGSLAVDPFSVARKLPSEKQFKALEMAQNMKILSERKDHIDRYRAQVNFSYWESRCEAEQDDSALAARTGMYEANKALDLGKLDEAIEKYEKAWSDWNTVFNRFPEMMVDEAADDVEKYIALYLRQIEKDTDKLPENFALKNFLEFRKYQQSDTADPAMMGLISQWADKYPDRNFLEEVISKSAVYAERVKQFRAENGTDMVQEPPLPSNKTGDVVRERPVDRLAPTTAFEGDPIAEKEMKKAPTGKDPASTEPKPEAPKPEEPKPEVPKTTEPMPSEPKTEDPKPSEPAPASEPKPEQPKPEEPKPEQPKPTEPMPEEPKPTEPKPAEPAPPSEPKPEEPKTEEPKPAEPKPEEPKTEEPKPAEEPKPNDPGQF